MHNILIIEDELLPAAEIEGAVMRLGHTPLGPARDFGAIQTLLASGTIEAVLATISVSGGSHNIATLWQLCNQFAIPALFITTSADSIILQKMRVAQPSVFLVKPFSDASLQTALAFAMSNPGLSTPPEHRANVTITPVREAGSLAFNTFIFVRKGYEYIKLFIKDIFYVEALQNYIRVYTDSDSFIIYSTLKEFSQKLPEYFLRTHRSYIVNLKNIRSYQEKTVLLGRYQVPVSRSCQEELMARIHVVR